MTISYQDQYFKLLLRWKGSLWKTIHKDLLYFLIIYYAINLVYRFVLSAETKRTFLNYIDLFDTYLSQIPLTFLLGFYVAMVIRRWWDQFQFISWPDQFLMWVSALIRGSDDETRIVRRTIARYCMLASVLAWRSLSVRVLKRFPTDEHLLTAGLMTRQEYDMFRSVCVRVDPHNKWFVPLNWIQSVLVSCLEQQRVKHPNELRTILEMLDRYRNGFFQLFLYDWVTIPLVYTQVATIAVYGYFGMCLIGRQYPKLNSFKDEVDIYIPIFTILQFLFYVGWLKVGEDLMFPFGSDDEDFEFNYILDRNLEISYLLIDDLHGQMPAIYSDGLEHAVHLHHTRGSQQLTTHRPFSHVAKTPIGTDEAALVRGGDGGDGIGIGDATGGGGGGGGGGAFDSVRNLCDQFKQSLQNVANLSHDSSTAELRRPVNGPLQRRNTEHSGQPVTALLTAGGSEAAFTCGREK